MHYLALQFSVIPILISNHCSQQFLIVLNYIPLIASSLFQAFQEIDNRIQHLELVCNQPLYASNPIPLTVRSEVIAAITGPIATHCLASTANNFNHLCSFTKIPTNIFSLSLFFPPFIRDCGSNLYVGMRVVEMF